MEMINIAYEIKDINDSERRTNLFKISHDLYVAKQNILIKELEALSYKIKLNDYKDKWYKFINYDEENRKQIKYFNIKGIEVCNPLNPLVCLTLHEPVIILYEDKQCGKTAIKENTFKNRFFFSTENFFNKKKFMKVKDITEIPKVD